MSRLILYFMFFVRFCALGYSLTAAKVIYLFISCKKINKKITFSLNI